MKLAASGKGYEPWTLGFRSSGPIILHRSSLIGLCAALLPAARDGRLRRRNTGANATSRTLWFWPGRLSFAQARMGLAYNQFESIHLVVEARANGDRLVVIDLVFPEVGNAICTRYRRSLISADERAVASTICCAARFILSLRYRSWLGPWK